MVQMRNKQTNKIQFEDPKRRDHLGDLGIFGRVHSDLEEIWYSGLPNATQYTRAARKVSNHFEYLENWSRGLDVTWQPVRGDLTVHP
jgi:hypothetical protein